MSDTKREAFAAAHRAVTPLLIYNVWDAGSAKAVADAGAAAIATGSLGVAGAQGFDDGQVIPLETLLSTARSIVSVTDLPVSVDIEGGYAADTDMLVQNAQRLADTGAVGCNFEDQIVGGEGFYPVSDQAQRIAAVTASGLFVNARTDLFLAPLLRGEDPNRADLVDQAVERALAYGDAGAECFFAPGLSDPALITELCEAANLPVNIMALPGGPDVQTLHGCGVSRISWGPGPWRSLMAQLQTDAAQVFAAF